MPQLHTPQNDTSILHALDFDLCLLNQNVINEILEIQTNEDRDATVEEIISSIITYNNTLIEFICKSSGYYTLFSNRTCYQFDVNNWIKRVTDSDGKTHSIHIGSCFTIIENLFERIAPGCLIRSLLVDSFAKTKKGTNFTRLIDKNKRDDTSSHPTCPFENRKILLTYFQAHQEAERNPNVRSHQINIYDSNQTILQGLRRFNLELIPKSVTINAYWYDGRGPAQPQWTITGTGKNDPHYDQTIQWIAARSIGQDSMETYDKISWFDLSLHPESIDLSSIKLAEILKARDTISKQTKSQNLLHEFTAVSFFNSPREEEHDSSVMPQQRQESSTNAQKTIKRSKAKTECCCEWW